MKKFIRDRLKGGWYAIKGAYLLLRYEHSIQAQFFIGLCVCLLGWFVGISRTEWMMQLFAIGLVMGLEGANSAIEEIADFIHPDFHEKIGKIKDLAAGAVFIGACVAVIIGLLIYCPYINF
ncbi:diacylglycerol kinase family protein [Mesonia sp. HuA40]|uniref:diacylglycerol kinase family protein n=1 Tax=Mesonia sp. HuA40 TaxID=2602761 RepID=UPI0011C78CB6|nr:diacylglycerol kinase family protein [Mesonia sp. HuA40]TXK70882.1 diacylglycerol kinase family protein [Mesonia sp. HuA40]